MYVLHTQTVLITHGGVQYLHNRYDTQEKLGEIKEKLIGLKEGAPKIWLIEIDSMLATSRMKYRKGSQFMDCLAIMACFRKQADYYQGNTQMKAMFMKLAKKSQGTKTLHAVVQSFITSVEGISFLKALWGMVTLSIWPERWRAPREMHARTNRR